MNVIDTCAVCRIHCIVFLSSLKCKFATWYLSNTGECNTTYMYLTKHSEQNHVEDKNAICSASEDKELVFQIETFGCFKFLWFWKVNFSTIPITKRCRKSPPLRRKHPRHQYSCRISSVTLGVTISPTPAPTALSVRNLEASPWKACPMLL